MSGINKDAGGNLTLKDTLAGQGLEMKTENGNQVLSVIPTSTVTVELLKQEIETLKSSVEILTRVVNLQTDKITALQNK